MDAWAAPPICLNLLPHHLKRHLYPPRQGPMIVTEFLDRKSRRPRTPHLRTSTRQHSNQWIAIHFGCCRHGRLSSWLPCSRFAYISALHITAHSSPRSQYPSVNIQNAVARTLLLVLDLPNTASFPTRLWRQSPPSSLKVESRNAEIVNLQRLIRLMWFGFALLSHIRRVHVLQVGPADFKERTVTVEEAEIISE